ncbi:MAG TPA: PQQ-dependent sugar dehydrogenase [Thermoanaerobaculia bacterium]|nr:PQQ-dependent sugar dehydrogenase [Thermoanaerobaculia bacterium]
MKFLRTRRWSRAALAAGIAAAFAGGFAGATVVAPVITEPEVEGQIISPFDVHMVAGPFVGDSGETHLCSDWNLAAMPSQEIVWSASCVTGVLAVHIHLGDGVFGGSLSGHHQLDADKDYQLQVRFKGSSDGGQDWSPWSMRGFHTAVATAIEPLILSDISTVPPPAWRDTRGRDVILPPGARLTIEAPNLGTLLQFQGAPGYLNTVTNPGPLSGHGAVRVVAAAAVVRLTIGASHVTFTDGSGQDRDISLPPVDLSPSQSATFWISDAGEAFAPNPTGPNPPTFGYTNQLSAADVPWAVQQPGFRIEKVATGFQLPIDIAFVPNPGPNPGDPFFYVTELYGSVAVVSRNGAWSTYASDLLNFDPLGSFPGSGEKGTTGVAVEPVSGDLFVGTLEAQPNVTDYHFPMVVRLHSTDGGRTAASRTTILDFPNEPLGPSHQISSVTLGPDGKLYVHIGDGMFVPTPAQDMTSVRGKILRVNLDGSAPPDNPFYNAADGLSATDLIYALGFRNPFGGSWRALDGAQWEVENGPSVDRIARVVAGRNYLYDGSDASMTNYAAYNWGPPAVAPVNVAFVQASSFGGSGFPADHLDHAFVTESGATYAPGPQASGKRISDFSFDAAGNLVGGPLPLVQYIGAGRSTATALAAGPDGLYFADLYKDFGAATPVDPGANVFRIRYVGVADFSADLGGVQHIPEDHRFDSAVGADFHDASSVPGASAWHWDFGDGTSSDAQNPSHIYVYPGTFDVRLTVTGPAGAVSRQKAAFVTVASPDRALVGVRPPRPTRDVDPR